MRLALRLTFNRSPIQRSVSRTPAHSESFAAILVPMPAEPKFSKNSSYLFDASMQNKFCNFHILSKVQLELQIEAHYLTFLRFLPINPPKARVYFTILFLSILSIWQLD